MEINNSLGLSFAFLDNSAIKSIEATPIRISLKDASPFSKSGANIYIRKRTQPFEFKALFGPESNCHFTTKENLFVAKGSWSGIDYTCILQLSDKSLSWLWSIDIHNTNDNSMDFDLIYVQDIGMKPAGDGLINEYYVSQYLERLILEDSKFGKVVCCRQNTKESVGNPWVLLACKNGSISASTDGMQFLGKTFRETGIPEGLLSDSLGGEYSGESSVIAIQEKPFSLSSGESYESKFIATYMPDHPNATADVDLRKIPGLLNEFQDAPDLKKKDKLDPPEKNIFNSSDFLPVEDLNEEEINQLFDKEKRHCEFEDGKLLSFFYGQNKHVMLRAKEILSDRPHGHIMQAQSGFEANENIVSTTSYAFGVFNSHITQGNTNFNVFLSIITSQFNQSPETGQRIFISLNGWQYLLGVPSAFEMGLNHCRWIYKSGESLFQVRTWTSKKSPRINLDFEVIQGKTTELFITHHYDENNGWTTEPGNFTGEFISKPKPESMIAGKFPKAQFRILVNSKSGYISTCDKALYSSYKNQSDAFFVLDVKKTSDFCMSIIGEVCNTINIDKIEDADKQFSLDCMDAQFECDKLCMNLSLQGNQKDVMAFQEIIPWFGMNAITHFLTPHGLEQFGGAAWGTRDVSQGPFDLLLSTGKYSEAKKVLRSIFSNQNPVGDWAQWWMFDSYFNVRAGDCHGDVYYWCIIALVNYVRVTGDVKILNEILPYYHEKGIAHAEKTPLSEHLDRLIKMIVDSFIPGTALVPFGGGDWNDSLQPVSHELAQRMISSWTVEMNYQAFALYQMVYELTGHTAKAKELKNICGRIKSDFNKYLVKDGIVAGYGLVEKDKSISVLLHPVDDTTNIRYSILPMDRGVISGIFSLEQAEHHQELIKKHLKGPDGARLMDRPLKYKGGIQTIFQRAESSTFFGREIGLMYIHEHIRYAESQAILGNADAFVKALRQANPVGYRDIVTCGDIRQSNCYYSSSDVTFKSRYDADERYDEIKTGKITLRGGWRVYSSGPGIFITLILNRLLGIRTEAGKIIIDPVIPESMDGLSASLNYFGHILAITYFVKQGVFAPKSITVNGKTIKFDSEENKYRKGGAVIQTDQLFSLLNGQLNKIEIYL